MTLIDYILIGLYYTAWYGAPVAAVIGVYRVLTADWQAGDGEPSRNSSFLWEENPAEKNYQELNWAMYGQSTIPIGMGVDFGDD